MPGKGRPFQPGHKKLGGSKPGSQHQATKDRDLLLRMAERLDSSEYEDNAWMRMLRGRAPHLESYFLTRIKGKADETLQVKGDVVMRWQSE